MHIISPVNVEERKTLGVRAGDTVRVHQKIKEGQKTRIQIFEGLVLAVKHGTEAGATFTVRATLSGVGVEKIFPLYSPNIDKIEIVKRSKVRRAKLYFIREKVAREVKRQLRRVRFMDLSTVSERVQADDRTKAAEAAEKEAEEAAKAEAQKAEEALAATAEEATPEAPLEADEVATPDAPMETEEVPKEEAK